MKGTWRVGNWDVNLSDGWLRRRRGLLRRRVYPDGRAITVLETLMASPGELISTERILAAAWADRVVTRDSVSTAIYQLRQLLGDDSTAPAYIRTEPRRGYRLIARVAPRRELLKTRSIAAAGAGVALLGYALLVHVAPNTRTNESSAQLYVVPLENVTGDPALEFLSVAMDATLVSALVRMNPREVAGRLGNDASPLRLESQVVACDLGPALVVRLLDVHEQHYSWSGSYPLYGNSSEPTVVEHVARDVTEALAQL